MRTTLTLDDDLAARLKQRSREQDRRFKDVVNEAIRVGLATLHEPPHRQRSAFRVVPFTGGRPRLPLITSTGELLTRLDESEHGP